MFSLNINTPSCDLCPNSGAEAGHLGERKALGSDKRDTTVTPPPAGPLQNPVGLDPHPLVKNNSPPRPHTSQLPTSLLCGSPPRSRLHSRIRHPAGTESGRMRRVSAERGRQRPPRPRRLPSPASWRDGATTALACRPGSPDFASLGDDPSLPCCRGVRGRGRPRRRLGASSACHGRERGRGTRDNRERGALGARVAPPAGRAD